MLVACSTDNHDLVSYIQQVKQQAPAPIAPIPEFKFLVAFKWMNHKNKRNPFKPTGLSKYPLATEQAPRQSNLLLKTYRLERLKFVGTLMDNKRCRGLIATPDMQIIPVRVGDRIGKNHGRVLVIKNDALIVNETIKGNSGARKQHRITLKLSTGTKE